ncbi:hypothetical protein K1T71_000750 [Dendrolimus kikuchii]|uniref:Uncharacterized protein n=1 Tax=Dendrolimus kikuchii TaxID=765133 RepID=A0ACC1DL40_9NEOP|nr:hypothetical protein K1T71_000750 [Dendrolimus kikuchii]
MMRLLLLAALFHCCLSQQYQQKVAPGVPPQNYQNYQPPPPPQMNQPPPPPQQQQYQPPPPQQQQYQQQQPQQQYQQAPVQPVQAQHGSHGDPQLLNPANIAQERDHIQEHMDVPIDTSKMSEQELQFHYFKMHDADNNNKLDGCELIKSLIHWHGPGEEPKEQRIVYQDKDFEEMANGALEQADFNNDGFIDYAEFRRATGV